MRNRPLFVDRRRELCSKNRQRPGIPAIQNIHGRQDKELERYHRRNRIPRQTEDQLVAACSKNRGPPGTNRNSRVVKFGAEIGEHLLDQIVLAHRNAPGKNQDVRFEAAFYGRPQRNFFIGSVSELDSFRATSARQNFERDSIAVANLERAGSCPRVDDFIPGGKDGQARLGKNFEACGSGLCRESQFGITQASSFSATRSDPARASAPRGTK